MGHLVGLKEYLDTAYSHSVFDQALQSEKLWEFHLHGHRIIKARVAANLRYDLKVDIADQGQEELPKVQIKLLYPVDLAESVKTLTKFDKKIQALGLSPILSPEKRYFVKNKSLFPLMKERQVVFFTLLEGEVIRGVVADFSRYDITVNLKGGTPIVIMRHSVYDLRNKQGRCFLKSFQDEHKDWQTSDLFVS